LILLAFDSYYLDTGLVKKSLVGYISERVEIHAGGVGIKTTPNRCRGNITKQQSQKLFFDIHSVA
jgi:hypothetical protein